MTAPARTVAVTGARGYLGSRICAAMRADGWHVAELARSAQPGRDDQVPYDLAGPVTMPARKILESAEVLVHCAYDMSLRRAADIWRVNVSGTKRLLEAATDAGVSRMIVLSSMSAFDGTTQLYGRAKLDVEALTVEFGGCAVRPGLVYGDGAGGMSGALRRMLALRLVPVIAGGTGVYTVREDDLMRAIGALASADRLDPGIISIAHPIRVTLRQLMTRFAAQEDRRCVFVPVPWQLVYGLLRSAEAVGLTPPFRADSVLGLVGTTGLSVRGTDRLAELGVTLQGFG
jgi:nucleoside-diphosphate-sugar epimerase